jgi:hypothetical protein
MYANALTAFRTDSPKIPVFFQNDKEVLNTIFDLAGVEDPSTFRIVWIKNTLELREIIVSEYFFDQIESRGNLSLIGDEETIKFDENGFLVNSKKFWFKNK